jgi:hypothetical protein
VLTGLGLVIASAAAAAAAIVLSHRFGRSAATDGFLAAYGVYLVLALAAQSFRVVVLPALTRAAGRGELGAEARAWMTAFSLLGAPVIVLVVLARRPIADALTGSSVAAHEAARALPFLVAAAFVQLIASLLASALAATDRYAVASFAWAAGNLVGLAVFATLSNAHGLVALAWGVLIGAIVTACLPLGQLLGQRTLRSESRVPLDLPRRLFDLTRGVAVPLAVQGMYVISLALAATIGVGVQSSLSYAYLFAATLVAATASSLSLVSSAPLTRRGLDADGAAAHVVHASWLSFAAIAAATGVFAILGTRLVGGALGHAYSGAAGDQLGRLIVYLAPWMVAAVAFAVVFPLVFVVERAAVLLPLAIGALVVHVPISLALRAAFGVDGLALALAVTTALVLVVLLAAVSPHLLEVACIGLVEAALILAALATAAFGLAALALPGIGAAIAGLAIYAGVLVATRPRGLREAWAYVRVLH